MKTFKDYVNEAKTKFKVGDKVKEVEPMGQFKPGDVLEIVQIKSGRIGVIAQGQNPKDALFDNPKNFKLVNEAESLDSLDEANMYKSEYLSDDDVRRIAIFTGGSWNKFEKRVNDGIKQYLELTLDGAKNIKLDKVDINGYLIATAQSRLWVKRIQYTFELDGDRHTGEIKNQEIWVTL